MMFVHRTASYVDLTIVISNAFYTSHVHADPIAMYIISLILSILYIGA